MGRELDLTLTGDASITIHRDSHGIPHVRASYDSDLLRGLGYCHAVDRGIALRVTLAIAWGRASELLTDSEELYAIDVAMRRLGLHVDVAEELAKLTPAHRVLLDAYVDGVNRGLRATGTPWELKIAGYVEQPFAAADCVLLTRLTAWVGLAQSQGEMERLLVEMVQAGVPRSHLDALVGQPLEDLDPWLLKRVQLGERVVPAGLRWPAAVAPAIASNNWVIAAARSASGAPLLANDPHLDICRLPAVWAEVCLEGPDTYALGATMPGLPAILIGRNTHVAWGVTYAFQDGVDSWIEDCKEGAYRRVDNARERWLSFRQRTERIVRRSKGTQEHVFYENDHGVLEGDPQARGMYLATRWACARGTGATSLAVALSLLRARDTAATMRLLGHMETGWSWVVAGDDGHCGFQMSGKVPRRPAGRSGLVPLPGWDPGNDWLGFVATDRLPWLLDPPEGFFATANQDLNHYGKSRPSNLTMADWRAQRIRQALAAHDGWTVAQMQALQLDLTSLHAQAVLEELRPLLPDTPAGRDLAGWDGRYDPAATAPSRFEAVWRALVREVCAPWLGKAVVDHLFDETAMVADFYECFDRIVRDPASPWYGDRKRADVWRQAAAAGLGQPAPPWGEVNRLTMRHLVLGGRLPRWLGFDIGPLPLPGGRASVHQGQVFRAGGREATFAPSYRFACDLAERGAHTTLPGGPSDRRLSRWYASELPRWRRGELKVLAPGPVPPAAPTDEGEGGPQTNPGDVGQSPS